MELKEKAISLAEELGIDFGEVHRVIGVSASTLEAAFNGHKKAFDSVTKFFTDREAAFQMPITKLKLQKIICCWYV